ncbi:hypothetical protein FRB98_004166 [Tulasnella sp. 332]|nr:hypothetical protein FRB98_004166 [Tulasnella sp. 332]
MNKSSSTATRKAPIQYGKRAATIAARRASFQPPHSRREDDDDDDDDMDGAPAPATSSRGATSGYRRRESFKAEGTPNTPSPHRNPKQLARGTVVEVVIVSPFKVKGPLGRTLERQSGLEALNSLPKGRKSVFEHLADRGDVSTGLESDDPSTLTPSKRSRRKNMSTCTSVKQTDLSKPDSSRSPVASLGLTKRKYTPAESRLKPESPRPPAASTPVHKKQLSVTSPSSPSKKKRKVLDAESVITSSSSAQKSSRKQADAPASSTQTKPPLSLSKVVASSSKSRVEEVLELAGPSRQVPMRNSNIRKLVASGPPSSQTSPVPSPTLGRPAKIQIAPLRTAVSSEDVIMLSPRKRPAGVAKRMLGRTRSAAELETTAVQPLPDSAPSTRPSSPSEASSPFPSRRQYTSPSRVASAPKLLTFDSLSRPSLVGPSQSIQTQSSRDDRDVSPPPSRPVARTYGKSRSFLVELTSTSILEPGGGDSQDSGVKESYNDLRTRWGVDMSEELAEGSGLAPSDLRTMTEMRNKGETRKFLDELGYLFEGLDPSMSLSVRRLSAIDIVSKMTDPEFVRKARITDILSKVWDVLRDAGAGSGDPILDIALISFVAFVAQDPRAINDLSAKPDFDSVLDATVRRDRNLEPFQFLDEDYSVDGAKRAGIGKAERNLLRTMDNMLLQSSLGHEGSRHITGRALASFVLRSLPRKKITPDQLRSTLVALLADLIVIQSRVEAFVKGLSSIPPPQGKDAPDLHLIENCLKMVEICMYSQSEDDSRQALGEHVEDLATGLIALGVFCEVVVANKDVELASPAIISPPRATHTSDPSSSDDVMDVDDPPPSILPQETNLDSMCYALGLLTNILQHDEKCAGLVGKTVMSNSCQRDRSCLKKCKCSSKEPVLKSLVSLYEKQAHCGDEPILSPKRHAVEAHFLRGHLAVMLGFLAIDEENKERLLADLPGTSPCARIDALVDTIRDFINVFEDATRKMEKLVVPRLGFEGEAIIEETQMEVEELSSEDRVEGSAVSLSFGSRQSVQRDHETVNMVLLKLQHLRDSSF